MDLFLAPIDVNHMARILIYGHYRIMKPRVDRGCGRLAVDKKELSTNSLWFHLKIP